MGISSAKSPLVAVAHGSRDPRSAATIHAVLRRVRALRPDLDVRAAFLDLTAPSVPQVLGGLAAEGHRRAVVVPLLLGSAYHARVDLPGLLARVRGLDIAVADVLGADDRLITAVRDRVEETGVPAARVAVVAVGTSSVAANRRLEVVTRRIGAATGRPAALCFATDIESVRRAVSGPGPVVVVPWMLAPGRLLDRVSATGALLADPIGDHPLLAEVILDRHAAAVANQPLPRTA